MTTAPHPLWGVGLRVPVSIALSVACPAVWLTHSDRVGIRNTGHLEALCPIVAVFVAPVGSINGFNGLCVTGTLCLKWPFQKRLRGQTPCLKTFANSSGGALTTFLNFYAREALPNS